MNAYAATKEKLYFQYPQHSSSTIYKVARPTDRMVDHYLSDEHETSDSSGGKAWHVIVNPTTSKKL